MLVRIIKKMNEEIVSRNLLSELELLGVIYLIALIIQLKGFTKPNNFD